MASKNPAYEELARHIYDNLPQYMPYVKYAGVFLVGFVCGMLWCQSIEDDPPAKPATKQTKKAAGTKSRVTRDDSTTSKGTGESKPVRKSTGSSSKKATSKLLDVPESGGAEVDPDALPGTTPNPE